MAFIRAFVLLGFLSAFIQVTTASQNILAVDPRTGLTQGWSYKNCTSPSDVAQLYSLDLLPDPPQPGQNLTVNVKGLVKERIEEGAYADVLVKSRFVVILRKRFNICDEARTGNASVQCPVEANEYEIEQEVALPNEIPRTSFTVHVETYTTDNRPMLCLDIAIDFKKSPFPSWLGAWIGYFWNFFFL